MEIGKEAPTMIPVDISAYIPGSFSPYVPKSLTSQDLPQDKTLGTVDGGPGVQLSTIVGVVITPRSGSELMFLNFQTEETSQSTSNWSAGSIG